MKAISPYVKYLIKENAPYIVIFFILIVLTFLIPSLTLEKFNENNRQIKNLEKEVGELRIKQQILGSLINESSSDIDFDVKFLNSLIPDKEDFFSILFTLDELSRQTGFFINSYSIHLKQTTKNKISLTITGVGDNESFLNLLKNYNFSGGRLVTAEKIEVNPKQKGSISLSVNFYSEGTTAIKDSKIDYKQTLDKLKKLKEKIVFEIKTPEVQEGPAEQYEKKSDLF